MAQLSQHLHHSRSGGRRKPPPPVAYPLAPFQPDRRSRSTRSRLYGGSPRTIRQGPALGLALGFDRSPHIRVTPELRIAGRKILEEQTALKSFRRLVEKLSHRLAGRMRQPGEPAPGRLTNPDCRAHKISIRSSRSFGLHNCRAQLRPNLPGLHDRSSGCVTPTVATRSKD
jgi:hypothetical protein